MVALSAGGVKHPRSGDRNGGTPAVVRLPGVADLLASQFAGPVLQGTDPQPPSAEDDPSRREGHATNPCPSAGGDRRPMPGPETVQSKAGTTIR